MLAFTMLWAYLRSRSCIDHLVGEPARRNPVLPRAPARTVAGCHQRPAAARQFVLPFVLLLSRGLTLKRDAVEGAHRRVDRPVHARRRHYVDDRARVPARRLVAALDGFRDRCSASGCSWLALFWRNLAGRPLMPAQRPVFQGSDGPWRTLIAHHAEQMPVEGDGVGYSGIAWFVVILAVTTVFCQALVWGMFESWPRREEARDPARSIVADAGGHAACRQPNSADRRTGQSQALPRRREDGDGNLRLDRSERGDGAVADRARQGTDARARLPGSAARPPPKDRPRPRRTRRRPAVIDLRTKNSNAQRTTDIPGRQSDGVRARRRRRGVGSRARSLRAPMSVPPPGIVATRRFRCCAKSASIRNSTSRFRWRRCSWTRTART